MEIVVEIENGITELLNNLAMSWLEVGVLQRHDNGQIGSELRVQIAEVSSNQIRVSKLLESNFLQLVEGFCGLEDVLGKSFSVEVINRSIHPDVELVEVLARVAPETVVRQEALLYLLDARVVSLRLLEQTFTPVSDRSLVDGALNPVVQVVTLHGSFFPLVESLERAHIVKVFLDLENLFAQGVLLNPEV